MVDMTLATMLRVPNFNVIKTGHKPPTALFPPPNLPPPHYIIRKKLTAASQPSTERSPPDTLKHHDGIKPPLTPDTNGNKLETHTAILNRSVGKIIHPSRSRTNRPSDKDEKPGSTHCHNHESDNAADKPHKDTGSSPPIGYITILKR